MSRSDQHEPGAVAERYGRRPVDDRYSLLRPDVWQTVQERQRAMLRLFARPGVSDLATLRLLEVGCGAGGNLLELLRIGFAPAYLSGVELLPERYAQARAVLPPTLRLIEGDAFVALCRRFTSRRNWESFALAFEPGRLTTTDRGHRLLKQLVESGT